jgi:hypothetical protein
VLPSRHYGNFGPQSKNRLRGPVDRCFRAVRGCARSCPCDVRPRTCGTHGHIANGGGSRPPTAGTGKLRCFLMGVFLGGFASRLCPAGAGVEAGWACPASVFADLLVLRGNDPALASGVAGGDPAAVDPVVDGGSGHASSADRPGTDHWTGGNPVSTAGRPSPWRRDIALADVIGVMTGAIGAARAWAAREHASRNAPSADFQLVGAPSFGHADREDLCCPIAMPHPLRRQPDDCNPEVHMGLGPDAAAPIHDSPASPRSIPGPARSDTDTVHGTRSVLRPRGDPAHLLVYTSVHRVSSVSCQIHQSKK